MVVDLFRHRCHPRACRARLAPAHVPHELAQWSGTKLSKGPARAVRAGDRLVFRAGTLQIIFDVLHVRAPQQLTLDIALAFGVKNREQIQITPVDPNSCRTTFN
jgi:hypothetical protein